ncbi:hypothetical protein ACSSS7_001798 [Eimeria intestinalis]
MKFLMNVLCFVTLAALSPACSSTAFVAAASAPGEAVKNGNSGAAASAQHSDVQVLTDSNFEQETQAVTGSTSGDWFVKFYAPWCGHCRKMAPAWEELATKLKGQINVAHLDATTNPQIARRFSIRGFPSLLFLKDGQMYEYKGARTVEGMHAFATGGWEKTTGKPIPPVTSFFDMVKEELLSTIYQLRDVFIQFPAHSILLLCIGGSLGAVLTCFWTALCTSTKKHEKTHYRKVD